MTTTIDAPAIPGITMAAPAAVAPAYSGEHTGGHWYTCDATAKYIAPEEVALPPKWSPLYEKDKTFTLREARKVTKDGGYAVPSVTTYLAGMAKPSLDKWKTENVANATFDVCSERVWDVYDGMTPERQSEYRQETIQFAIARASGASRGAMDLGTKIHDAMESLMKGQDYPTEVQPYIEKAHELRLSISADTHPEECIGSLKYGYAGRCDDWSSNLDIIDYKSRKSGKNGKVGSYETDQLQLAAYGFAKFGNDFFKRGAGHIIGISTTTPGVVTHHKFTGPELVPAFQAFLALTAVWRFLNDFDPRRTA